MEYLKTMQKTSLKYEDSTYHQTTTFLACFPRIIGNFQNFDDSTTFFTKILMFDGQFKKLLMINCSNP